MKMWKKEVNDEKEYRTNK